MTYPDYVDKIIERLEAAGFEAYVVGGGLRDILLGRAPNDFDVTTSATPEEMTSVFSDMKTIPTGLKHGTLTVLSDGKAVEVTTYRVDGEYSDSRHPESVRFTASLCEDLARRDFTVNAMAYNKKRGLVDPFGARVDLENKLLRAVGDPNLRMTEDALRILRALRFEAQLGFSIEEKTEAALRDCRDGLKNISGERRGVEFLKLVTAPYPALPLGRMLKLGIGKYILGDYAPSTKLIEKLSLASPSPEARLGMLLSECGEIDARKILRSLKYSNALTDKALLVASGSRERMPESDVELRRFIVRFGNEAETVAELASLLGTKDIRAELARIRKKGLCESVSELAVSGADLISLGFSGKEIGNALAELFELVTEHPEENERELLLKKAREIKIAEKEIE